MKCVCPAWSRPPRVFPPSSCHAHPRWRSSPAWMSLLLDALLRSSAAAHHQPALICSGEALLALRLRCVASVCLCEWSVSARACRLCKKDCIGAERAEQSQRRSRTACEQEHHHSTHPRKPACRTPSKECTNINTVHYSTGTCNLARPPVHPRPHSVAAVCARVHVLPSCTRSSPSQAACVHLAR